MKARRRITKASLIDVGNGDWRRGKRKQLSPTNDDKHHLGAASSRTTQTAHESQKRWHQIDQSRALMRMDPTRLIWLRYVDVGA